MAAARRTESPKQQLSLHLDPDQLDTLRGAAERYKVAMSVLARDALARGIPLMLDARRKRPRPDTWTAPAGQPARRPDGAEPETAQPVEGEAMRQDADQAAQPEAGGPVVSAPAEAVEVVEPVEVEAAALDLLGDWLERLSGEGNLPPLPFTFDQLLERAKKPGSYDLLARQPPFTLREGAGGSIYLWLDGSGEALARVWTAPADPTVI